MGNKKNIKWLREASASQIKELKRSELEKLVTSSSRSAYQNIYNLKKQGLGDKSIYLMDNQGKNVSIISSTKAKKMTMKELKQKAIEIARVSKSKTTSTKALKQFYKKIEMDTKTAISNLTSKDWEAIRRLIEQNRGQYSSEQIINAYVQTVYGMGEKPNIKKIKNVAKNNYEEYEKAMTKKKDAFKNVKKLK